MRDHLIELCCDEPVASPRFRGTQAAADSALAAFDVGRYSVRRNEVWPVERRGASGLSPWIRHGLLPLPAVWDYVDGPAADVEKFRDELLWQEYGRHLYARLGRLTSKPLRAEPNEYHATAEVATSSIDAARLSIETAQPSIETVDPWNRRMACVDLTVTELERDGWLVNQTRMWLASQWSVRHGAPWRDGEDRFFRHLLDGSRAANRLGWQWTIGTGTGKPYGFSRYQVTRRAPGLCEGCALSSACPIEDWPPTAPTRWIDPPTLLRRDADTAATSGTATTSGPSAVEVSGTPAVVWLTAESLGDADPALAAWPELPVVFIFDRELLARLRLSGKRLVFIAERLAELAGTRSIEVWLGDPIEVLQQRPTATTFAPVPGWRRRAAAIKPVALHPWPWLRQPGPGSLTSYSAWRGRAKPSSSKTISDRSPAARRGRRSRTSE